VILRPQQGGA